MVIDIHVHISANQQVHGSMSPRLLGNIPFRFMKWKFGFTGTDADFDPRLEQTLANTIAGASDLNAAVVLAFDAVYTRDGQLDAGNTHLYVANDYVMELCRRHGNMRFGCSVHPYRKDAVEEIERCVRVGAVLIKWLPIVQNFNPADERCFPVYEALAHYKLPLLSHTGGERSLPCLDYSFADPVLLKPALQRGVTVIAAHCGTKSTAAETDYLPTFARMALEYEHFHGDTAALNLPSRWYAWKTLLSNPALKSKLLHGSDWPILSIPPLGMLGIKSLTLFTDGNWMRRDMEIKKRLGLDDEYWQRAAKVLQIG